ncbi:phosphoenolpyruvate synthase [Kineococcus gynurae]|uniref:Phosphoenolpyruvate synthase n=1 Tax=Kineococcus gynurae TaxID=452979 RepID=A0ABV5LPB9_9ACTN
MSNPSTNVRWFRDISLADIGDVGGKNSSLGEMISTLADAGVRVPDGFATTSEAFHRFLAHDGLDERIQAELATLDVEDVRALSATGAKIRAAVVAQQFPADLERDIRTAWTRLAAETPGLTVAVRSSATAEDLPDASFAGQQETFLNVDGIEDVLLHVREVFASLYNDRAIAYRVHQGYAEQRIALSAGVQVMVRSDLGAAGVMFTLDTESGFDGAVFITSSYGLGEAVVQGAVNPDEFYVSKTALDAGRPAVLRREIGGKAVKMVYGRQGGTETVDVDAADRRVFSIDDADVTELARAARVIEQHYGRPMDVEWAKDGITGRIHILQARPETVRSQQDRSGTTSRYVLRGEGPVLIEGRAIGQRIGKGRVRVLRSIEDMHTFEAGDVLVADMTDPDWEPILKRAAAVVTDRGGRTCHAAIIARELGIPAVVGTGSATATLREGQEVTVSCAAGDTGTVHEGLLEFEVETSSVGELPELGVDIMLNVGSPEQAFTLSRLPNRGVGLARLEFVVNRQIGIHPRALLETEELPEALRREIEERSAAYGDPRNFYVSRIAEGVATIAAAFAPAPVIVRLSDFKSNEYANLLGGNRYEPDEENPMLGHRGAARYLSKDFEECFALECEALRRVRDDMGFTNVKIMVPFVRTLTEAAGVVDLLGRHGLRRGQNGLELLVMCEIPANALLADEFLEHFDGFSIGSNDLTQLTLGVDRDSGLVASSFDERDPAVRKLISAAVEACRAKGRYVGICGQGPSDYPDFAAWLLEIGISSISLNPDTVVDTWTGLAGSR